MNGEQIFIIIFCYIRDPPTYIQEMISDERYGSENILSSINFQIK